MRPGKSGRGVARMNNLGSPPSLCLGLVGDR